MKYAVVENSKVIHVVIADEALEDNWVQVDDMVKIGDYRNADGTFATPSMTWDNIRTIRSTALAREFDPLATNQGKWNDLTSSEQTAWIQYRRDWLDITDQDVDPNEVSCPLEPYWQIE